MGYTIGRNRKDAKLLCLSATDGTTIQQLWDAIHGGSFDGYCQKSDQGHINFASFQKEKVIKMLEGF